MKISYAITVKDELAEIIRLISFLEQCKRNHDEIVVLFDDGGSDEVWQYLLDQEMHFGFKSNASNQFVLGRGVFNNDFAEWKNKLNDLCTGDYIFNIDADEYPNIHLVENLPFILENNESDILLVPRVNTVERITEQHIKAWGWKQNEKGWIQWPDHQWRIYKNNNVIKWKNKLHEVLDGYTSYANLPEIEEYALYHPKTIEKQVKQNLYYSTL